MTRLAAEPRRGDIATTEFATGAALITGALLLAALLAAVRFRRRAQAAEAELAQGRAARDAASAVTGIQREQFIRWAGPDGVETPSPGLARLLGRPAAQAGWFTTLKGATLKGLLADADAEALGGLVTALRKSGEAFRLDVKTADGTVALRLAGEAARAGDDGTWEPVLLVLDDSEAARHTQSITAEAGRLGTLLDMLPLPVWMRNADLGLAYANRAYREAVEADPGAPAAELSEIAGGAVADQGRALARDALANNESRSQRHHIVMAGERRLVELSELPLPVDGAVGEAVGGFALDHTEEEEMEGDLSRHIAGHQEVLQNLGTAVAIYGADESLQFYNNAFLRLWRLDEAWLDNAPRMAEVLEELRDHRRLPEFADFPAFKKEQLKLFTSLMEPLEELVYLPDGTTLRSVVAPHPFGGLVLAWEDVTDALALEQSYNTLIAVQRETLDKLYEGVAVIGGDGRLRLSNPAFGRMWQIPAAELEKEPQISEIVERMRELLGSTDDWELEKRRIIGLLSDREPSSGRLERVDGSVLDYATRVICSLPARSPEQRLAAAAGGG